MPEPEPADPPTFQPVEAPSAPADPPTCEPRTPSTPVQGTTPVRFRPYRNSTAEDGAGSSFQLALMREMVEMHQAIDTLAKNRRIASYEATQKTALEHQRLDRHRKEHPKQAPGSYRSSDRIDNVLAGRHT